MDKLGCGAMSRKEFEAYDIAEDERGTDCSATIDGILVVGKCADAIRDLCRAMLFGTINRSLNERYQWRIGVDGFEYG